MIEIQSVEHDYRDRPVLRGIDLTLSERRIAIVGSNGSGKSTFARLLNGLQVPTQGRVLVDGLDTKDKGKEIRQKVGFVFQNPDNQIVFPIVEEDLAFGMKNLGFTADQIAQKTDDILRRYDLEDHRDHPTHLLSGGQKQLLAIAGVLVIAPSYVVLDEPTTLLDLRNKRRVADAIAALDQTVIMATHDLDLVAAFDRVIVFDAGQVIADDVPQVAISAYVKAMS